MIFFNQFLLFLLFVLPEPPFRLFFFLLNLSVDLLRVLFRLLLFCSFGIYIIGAFAHEIFGPVSDLFNVLIKVHFESRCERLRLWDLLIFLLFLDCSPLGERRIILVDGIVPLTELYLINFFRQVHRAFWTVRLFLTFSRFAGRNFLKDLCYSTFPSLVVVFYFTVAIFIIVVFCYCSDFRPIEKLWISARTLFLGKAADVEKFLVCYFFFLFNLILEGHKLLRR